MRAGAHALTLLSIPLNVEVLTVLDEEPRTLVNLRRAVGSPPQTTIRCHLRELTKIGVLERRRQGEFPGYVDYELGVAGRELMEVVAALELWLASTPEGALVPGTRGATSAIKALVGGWTSTIMRALAAHSLSLTDLNQLINGVNYPTLERRLAAMRHAGMIEYCHGLRRARPYSVTGWLRRASAPLAAAALWESRNMAAQTAPITPLDIEAAFLLTVPSLRLDEGLSGACRLAASIRHGGEERFAGVKATVKDGQIMSCVSKLGGPANAWASGLAVDWIPAVLGGDPTRLEIGGESDLALAIIDGLHEALFRVPQAA